MYALLYEIPQFFSKAPKVPESLLKRRKQNAEYKAKLAKATELRNKVSKILAHVKCVYCEVMNEVVSR